MEKLAKLGIILTNVGIGVAALFFTVFLTGMLGFIGLILGLSISVASATLWWMAASAYNKFMKMQ